MQDISWKVAQQQQLRLATTKRFLTGFGLSIFRQLSRAQRNVYTSPVMIILFLISITYVKLQLL